MFLGFFFILAVGLGLLLLFASFFFKRNSLAKQTLMIIAASLLLVPFAFHYLGDRADKRVGKERAGVYQRVIDGKIERLTIEESGQFKFESDCSEFDMTGNWKYTGGDFETFTFECDTLSLPTVTSREESISIWFRPSFGCEQGEAILIRIQT